MTSARLSPTAISYPISIPGPKVIDTRTINLYVLPAKLPTDDLLRKSAKRAPHPHDCATWLHLTSADRPGHWQTGLSWHRCTPEYCGAVVVLFIFFFFSFRTALRRTLCIASNATVKIWMQMHYIIMIHLISIVILRCPDCRSSPIRRTEDLFWVLSPCALLHLHNTPFNSATLVHMIHPKFVPISRIICTP